MKSSMRTAEPQDEELLHALLEGDEQAFTSLYRRWQAGLFRFALQMSGSAAVAEDVTQEVFLTLIRDGRDYDPRRGSVSAYLYGIARNKVLRSFRHQSGGEEASAEPSSPAGGPLEELTRNESIRAVRDAVLALPAHYRETVVLCDLHEMPYEQAAQVLGCAVGTVRSRLHRARELLAGKLRLTGEPRAARDDAGVVRSFI
jgi:RNA polymerase sigma-70 factor (ECF subfamily)